MNSIEEFKLKRDNEIKDLLSNNLFDNDTSYLLSSSIAKLLDKKYDKSITSEDLDNKKIERKLDLHNHFYNNELAEIFYTYDYKDIELNLESITKCNPPIYNLVSYNDYIINVNYSTEIYQNEPFVLYFKYGTKFEQYYISLKLKEVYNDGKRIIFKNIFRRSEQPEITFYYDQKRKGLVNPRIKFTFSDEFWKIFKSYEKYLL